MNPDTCFLQRFLPLQTSMEEKTDPLSGYKLASGHTKREMVSNEFFPWTKILIMSNMGKACANALLFNNFTSSCGMSETVYKTRFRRCSEQSRCSTSVTLPPSVPSRACSSCHHSSMPLGCHFPLLSAVKTGAILFSSFPANKQNPTKSL